MNILPLIIIIAGDFSISTAAQSQRYPTVQFANDQFYVFWADYRYFSPDYSIFGARVTTDGTVLDPSGKQLFRDSSAFQVDAAYDSINFLVVFRNFC